MKKNKTVFIHMRTDKEEKEEKEQQQGKLSWRR